MIIMHFAFDRVTNVVMFLLSVNIRSKVQKFPEDIKRMTVKLNVYSCLSIQPHFISITFLQTMKLFTTTKIILIFCP